MEKLHHYQAVIEEGIKKLNLAEHPNNLYEPVRYILAMKGKRMRPVLTLMAADMFDVKPETVLPQALGIEVFHNFTLLHDDIMDNAPIRRNQPTVHEKWNVNTAILSGDAMLVVAYQQIANCNVGVLHKVISLFSKTAVKVCEGQQLDMDLPQVQKATSAEYLYMIERKTAVLLGCSLQLGALCAGADKQDQLNLYEFGKHMGIAFQLQDDILDAYANPDKFGKQVGGDIIEDKHTFLLITAMQTNPEATAKAMAKSNQEKVESMLNVYEACGVRRKAEELMHQHFDKAIEFLTAVKVDASKRQPLHSLAESLLVREY